MPLTLLGALQSGMFCYVVVYRPYKDTEVDGELVISEDDVADIVHWMPAHLTESSIGSAVCSNGEHVTEDMWCANQMVDLLARKCATLVTVGGASLLGRSSSKTQQSSMRESP